MKQVATLMPDGRIASSIQGQQMVFESPSAFRCEQGCGGWVAAG
jgi:hypothetical protein